MKQPNPTDVLATVPDTSSPAYATDHRVTRLFDTLASAVTRWAGSPIAFGGAAITIVIWVVTGPVFHYSDGWQLVINTGTTIVTFLMVFLIQQSQNKDSVALHLKLNELISAHRQANNHMIGIEDATEEALRRLAAAYLRLAAGDEGIASVAGHPDASTKSSMSEREEKPIGDARTVDPEH